MGSKRLYFVLVIMVALLASASASTRQRRHRHVRRPHARSSHRHLRHMVWNPLFPGSHEMLVRQNEQLDMLELPRIATESELVELEEADELVPVDDARGLTVASNLAETRRFCRPWTRDFLEDLGEAYYKQFRQPIVVTSLVRTAEQQKKLRRRNKNAAPEAGETVSTHLTGVTVDILKRGMSKKQHAWIEQYFLPLKQAGFIDPIEERRQPVFHIVVFNTYGDSKYDDDDLIPPDPLTVANTKAQLTEPAERPATRSTTGVAVGNPN